MDELILRGRMVRCNRLTDIHMVRVGVTGNIDPHQWRKEGAQICMHKVMLSRSCKQFVVSCK